MAYPDSGAPRTLNAPVGYFQIVGGRLQQMPGDPQQLLFQDARRTKRRPALTTPPRLPRVPMPYGAAAVSPE